MCQPPSPRAPSASPQGSPSPGRCQWRGYRPPPKMVHCSRNVRPGSKEPAWLSVLPLPYFVFRSLPEPDEIILVLNPDKPADDQGKDEKFLPLFVHDRHDRKAPEGCQRATG